MSPRDRRGPGGDDLAADDLAMLRDVFRDEAHEALEALANRLLAADTAELDDRGLTELMRITHTLKGSAGTVGLSALADAAHDLEERLAEVRKVGPWTPAVRDQLVARIDAIRGLVDAAAAGTIGAASVSGAPEKIDPDETVSLRLPTSEQAEAQRQAHPNARRARTEPPLDTGRDPGAALPRGDVTRTIVTGVTGGAGAAGGDEHRRDSRGVLRVDPGRIDRLMDSVSELVFDRTRIERRVRALSGLVADLDQVVRALRARSRATDPAPSEAAAIKAIGDDLAERIEQLQHATAELLDDTGALERTSVSLQAGLTRMRMSTARTLFQTLSRQLRAITRDAGKAIRLVTSGDDTEFDKSVAERITDPLVQLLRNAVAHGIEPAPARRAAGKPIEGEVRIHARQEGSSIIIEVADDGAGIDPDDLRERFVAAGRWTRAKAELASDDDVLHAIFDPGMSTRDQADPLAGRGVGLDTVRETIARLGGEVRMTSTPGTGTCFTLRLPVSTAVSQALIFEVYRDAYAVPEVHVVGTGQVERDGDDLPAHIDTGTERIPLVCLQDVLESASPVEVPVMPMIILEYAGKRVAITCDQVVGAREIVVKDLGPLLSPLPLYAGATISSAGKVQLILDPAALIRMAYPGAAPATDSDGPDDPDGPDAVPTPMPAAPSAPSLALAMARALVADDSPAVREVMARILVRSGYRVDSAADGASAWAMASATSYDLVVTDIDMPRLDGFALIERIREDRRLSRVPVIVVSSSDTPEHRERARRLGVAGFVQKPVTPGKLHAALDAL